MADPDFYSELKDTYSYYRDYNIISTEKLLKVVDDYAEMIDESQKLNFTRWDVLNKSIHQNIKPLGSYDAEVEHVRKYIRERIAWMDTKLNYTPKQITEPKEVITVRFHKPATWSEVRIFAWIPYKTSNLTGEAWPGALMKVEENGWYSYTFDSQEKNISLFFSDNGETLTTTISGIKADVCLGTNGEWGEDTKCQLAQIDCETGVSIDPNQIEVRFHKPASWQTVNIMAIIPDGESNPAYLKWPGVAMVQEENDWYSYTFGKNEKNITVFFNNGGNAKTSQVKNVNESTCYATTGEIVNTNCTVSSVDCETGRSVDPNPGSHLNAVDDLNGIKIWSSDNTIHIQEIYDTYNIRVVNMTGQIILNDIISADTEIKLPKGIYLMNLNNSSQKNIVFKCIVL